MGVHWGVPGPGVLMAVGSGGIVAAYEILVPEIAGWFPWFDQAEGEPMVFPFGPAYTQHVYIVPTSHVTER